MAVKTKAKKLPVIADMYELLNRELDCSYIESEGENCIRADFASGISIWFEIYGINGCERTYRGINQFPNAEVKNFCKKYKFTRGY